jgi:transposase
MSRPKGGTNKIYTGETKQEVVETMVKNKYSYREAARIYDIPDHSMVMKWERIYLEEGAKSLYIERRGRATKQDSLNIGRLKKLDKQVEEDLIAEVQRLRMEVDYLKKLNALVHQKEISARKIKHK